MDPERSKLKEEFNKNYQYVFFVLATQICWEKIKFGNLIVGFLINCEFHCIGIYEST
jgi:hypothetical protein